MGDKLPLRDLLAEVNACRVCDDDLPLGANPVVRASATARILIIGQAPGLKVHNSGIPWNDPSGDRLRGWMGVARDTFYDESKIAIVPMGFCYPGRGKSGDLPPRKECAPLWHEKLVAQMPAVELTLLIGNYAQGQYLDATGTTLTERVKDWASFGPECLPLVHPSPRNQRWLKKNPWFEVEVVPYLAGRIAELL